jgi:hypothetical protein
MDMKNQSAKVNFAVGVAWLAISVFLITYVLVGLFGAFVKAKESQDWLSVNGVITYSLPVIGCGKGQSFTPIVRYRYMVEGVEYEGSTIAFGSKACGSENDAAIQLIPYKFGKTLPVYFNQKSPQDSVLIHGRVSNDTWFKLAIMTALIIGFAGYGVVSIGRGMKIIRQPI